ncbi:UxaA family hydrolase, partial [Bacillus subtilis]|uniref:UxaA family hydrolase n=1 Tax=Bacillus subtilis TaxID=1423 RepID=UPI002078FBCF
MQGFVRETGDIGGFDKVVVLKDEYGWSEVGDDDENTKEMVVNGIGDGNGGGVLVLGVGCEKNEVGRMKEGVEDVKLKGVKFVEWEWVREEMEGGVGLVKEIDEGGKGE